MGRPSSLTIGSTPIWGRFGNFSWMRLQLDDTIQLLRCEVQESCTYNLAAQCILISLQPSDVAGNLEENRYVCFVFMLLPVLFQKKYEICSFFLKQNGKQQERGQFVDKPWNDLLGSWNGPLGSWKDPLRTWTPPPKKLLLNKQIVFGIFFPRFVLICSIVSFQVSHRHFLDPAWELEPWQDPVWVKGIAKNRMYMLLIISYIIYIIL